MKSEIPDNRSIRIENLCFSYDGADRDYVLDANNEQEIMKHLYEFYRGRTVVVVAHRLSTVRDADNIVVLDGGRIVEEGRHAELIERLGEYYRLVRNQING